jgi:pentatricopeptide repeat protein
MRYSLVLTVLLAGFGQEREFEDAETLFRSVEKRLRQSKGFRIELSHEARVNTDLQDQATARLWGTWDSSTFHRDWKLLTGQIRHWQRDKQNVAPPDGTANQFKILYQGFVSSLLAGGVQSWGEDWCPLLAAPPPEGDRPKLPYSTVSDFRWLPKEKGSDAQPIEYRLNKHYPTRNRFRTVKMWIDVSKKRPVKLQVTEEIGKHPRVSVETYSRYEFQ